MHNRLVFFSGFLLLLLHRRVFADESAVMHEMAALTGLSGDPCQWSGILCSPSGRVWSIDFPEKSLRGELPRDLRQLSELRRLNVKGNNLKGSLPDLSNLADLREARFDSNQFTDIPTGHLSGLTSLQFFSIDNNPNLTAWNVFTELGDSVKLSYLSACNAGVTGRIPEIFGSMESLDTLKLSYNEIEGPLPASLAGSEIQTLWLNNQKLSGGIDVIGSMPSVQQIWLHANQFSGPIPDLSNCKQLVHLNLRNNQFSGTISPAMANLTSLQNLTLNNNDLTGPIPAELTSLQDLILLDVSYNNLSGKVPDFPPYIVVNISGNPFIGRDLPPSPVLINPPPVSNINPPPPASSGSINRGKVLSPWAIPVAFIVANLL